MERTASVSELPRTYDNNEKLIELLNISCHSVKIKKLFIQQSTTAEEYELRPTLHVLLSFNAGAFKSQRLFEIEKAYKNETHPVHYANDVTAPGIAGSIDIKTREIVYPAAFTCKNGTLLIDEMNLNPNTQEELIRQMLSFTEYELTCRKIGLMPKKAQVRDKENNVEYFNGWLKFWNLRCNTILATLKNYRKASSGDFYHAMLTRFTPLRWVVTKEDLKTMMKNRTLIFHKIDYSVQPEVHIEEKDFDYITAVVEGYGEQVSTENFVRTINDCLRCFAVLQKHDEELYDFVITNRNFSTPRE